MNIKKYRFGEPFCTDSTVIDLPIEKESPDYISLKEDNLFISMSLNDSDAIYGLGEQMGGINKRGRKYRSFCSDDPCHTEEKEALYGAHNFFIISGETTVGYFIDFPGTVHYDMGFTVEDEITISLEGKDADFYVINGENELEVVKNFRELIGQSYMPPMWAFGYQQSRWSYANK